MRGKIVVAVLAIVVALVMAAPAFGAGEAKAASSAKPKLIVYAAASLDHVFPAMVAPFKNFYPKYKDTRFVFNFQGTDTLVAQIELGAPCDVFAGASTKYGNQLFTDGFIQAPTNFCQNKLVVIMPKSNPAHLKSLADLVAKGVEIAIGDPAVPIGTYTRTVLTNLNALYGPTYSTSVLANVVSNEVNVAAIVALVQLGEVDAGFVYVSDYKYGAKTLTHLGIANAYQSNPLPTYPIARTKSSTQPTIARAFIKSVLGTQGQKIMMRYGFLPKPTPIITAVTPKSGLAGSTVTITGAKFGSSGTVRFGSTTATTSAWSATSITATVPASLTAGTTKVTVSSGGLRSKAVTFTVTP